jgi:glycosyltransferase involved in cell wall biosynthesis
MNSTEIYVPNSSLQASVSLVIPSYNRAALIGQTIDSALAQSRPFLEIIVVDDGSTDNTAEVLARYGDKVTFVALAHGGVQAARNRGVELARGDYVTLCDSDDLLEPDFVATMLGWLDEHPDYDAVYSNFVTFDNAGNQHPDKFSLAPPGYFRDAQGEGEFLHTVPDLYLRTVEYQPLFMSGVVLRRKFYLDIGGFNTGFKGVGGEDWEFTLRVVAHGKVCLCKRPLTRIRRHGGNDSADVIYMMSGTADILEYALKAHPVAGQYRAAILKDIDNRRVGVFDAAFAGGNFELAKSMLGKLGNPPADKKFRTKVFITGLPPLLRQPIWRMTQ